MRIPFDDLEVGENYFQKLHWHFHEVIVEEKTNNKLIYYYTSDMEEVRQWKEQKENILVIVDYWDYSEDEFYEFSF